MRDPLRLLVAVGSRHDRVCSIGAFARAEVDALKATFDRVELLEPNSRGQYPGKVSDFTPDVVLFHAPSLHDRKMPWNALISAFKLRLQYPRALFVPVVHEFSEAPLHWRLRQAAIVKFSSGVIVNSEADYRGVEKLQRKILRTPLGPTLFYSDLLGDVPRATLSATLDRLRRKARSELNSEYPELQSSTKRWVVHPGLLTAGKGIEQLAKIPLKDARLLLMGGTGPKTRDREFAAQIVASLKKSTGDNVTLINSPNDSTFRKVLIAADLVVLPYDKGVSERRSSFLSAMCCGANVLTTQGGYSAALGLEETGVWISDTASIPGLVSEALGESANDQLARRLRNVQWARGRTWQNRVVKIEKFLRNLAPVAHNR